MRNNSSLGRRALAAALVAVASAPGCMLIGVDTYEESRETVEIESAPQALTGGAQWSRLDERRASLAFDARTAAKRVVEDVVEMAGKLEVEDDTWFNNEIDDLGGGAGGQCMFILVALPVIVLTPLVSGIVAIARLPFAGGEVRENRRDEGVVVHHWLDEAVLRDDQGHSLALGVCGREQATFALELEELARAGFTDASWQLTGGDLAAGPELSFPVEVDADSLAALKRIEAEALEREEAATLNVAAGVNLSAVLELAPPGAVVRLAAGEWVLDRGLILRNDVTIVGAGPDQTRLRSSNGNALLMWNPKDPQKRLELRGICFDGGDAQCPEGLVWLLGTAVVTDCRFTGARLEPETVPPKERKTLSNGVNLYVVDAAATFRRCRFESKEGFNVIVVQAVAGESRFDACVFDGGEHGLSIAGQGPATAAHCDFVGQVKAAFKVAEQVRGRLDQCVFDGAKYAISAHNQAELEVAGCRIQGYTSYGVWTTDGAKTTVRDCSFRSTDVAILQGSVPALQSNNRFLGVNREVADEQK